MKKLVFLIVLLLLLGGGAVGAMYFLELGPFEAAEAPPEETAEPDPDSQYVNMEPLNIPIMQGNEVVLNMQIQVTLDVPNEHVDTVEHNMPRLKDALVRDLYVYLPRLMRRSTHLDVIALKKHLNRVAEKALGPGLIRDVLVQSILDNPV